MATTRVFHLLRHYSNSTTTPSVTRSLTYREHGIPKNVLKLETSSSPLRSPGKGEVSVRMVAAPINLLDIDDIIGVRPQNFPAIGGNEGLGVVEKVGDGVRLSVGDWVIPNNKSFGGTWRSHAVVQAEDVDVIPSEGIQPEYAATLSLAPSTALRLLNDFEKLQKGDVIIQNAANSQVGQTVIQLANLRGIKTINIIRPRVDQDDTVERIKAYGGYIVVDENYQRSFEFQRLISDLPKPKLALNGAGGLSATEMARVLAPGGTLVTYGNASRQHLQLPTSPFLFNNITLKGFNLAQWISSHTKEERFAMRKELVDLIAAGKLRFWLETHRLSDWKSALEKALEEQKNRKVVMILDK